MLNSSSNLYINPPRKMRFKDLQFNFQSLFFISVLLQQLSYCVSFLFFFFNNVINQFLLFLAVLCLHCCVGFSLLATSRGSSLVVVHGLLIAVASLIVKYGLQGTRALVVAIFLLSSCGSKALEPGSIVVVHGLSCSVACGAFLDQGSNPCLRHCWADSLLLNHQGSPLHFFLTD